jgi:hypothetical protein
MPRPPLTPVARTGRLTASFTQEERLLPADRGPVPIESLATGLLLRGDVDLDALGAALAGLAARHEALRLSLGHDSDGGFLAVRSTPDVELEIREVAPEVPAGSRRADAIRMMVAAAERPFDHGGGPMVRACVVRADPARVLVGLTVDHFVSDGLSWSVLIGDLVALYALALGARDEELPPLPIQFADFAAWEHAYFDAQTTARYLRFWSRQVEADGPLPSLRLGGPRQPGGPVRGASVETALGASMARPVADLARDRGMSEYAVYTAALNAAIWTAEVADQRGTVGILGRAGNRTHPELTHAVGCFATPLVLRTDLGTDPTIGDALDRTAETVFAALHHQRMPFALLSRLTNPATTGLRYRLDAPPFLSYDLRRQRNEIVSPIPGLGITRFDLDRPVVPPGGLALIGRIRDDSVSMRLHYRADRYREDRVRGLLTQIERMLHLAIADPSARLSAAGGL